MIQVAQNHAQPHYCTFPCGVCCQTNPLVSYMAKTEFFLLGRISGTRLLTIGTSDQNPPHGEVVRHYFVTKSGLIVQKAGVLSRRGGDLRQNSYLPLEQLQSHDNLVTCHIWGTKQRNVIMGDDVIQGMLIITIQNNTNCKSVH